MLWWCTYLYAAGIVRARAIGRRPGDTCVRCNRDYSPKSPSDDDSESLMGECVYVYFTALKSCEKNSFN